ncbi:MAG: tetratricopeptide repeat protein, partial [Cyanothece sp. SIO1E1]|nr:tetratricopeptide repeat protein [Cyanothece sp. SIO1E1]
VAVAHQVAALYKVETGRNRAEYGNVEGAIALFREALAIYPTIDLDEKSENLDRNPTLVARRLARAAAPKKFQRGQELAKQRDIEGAITAFHEALKLDPNTVLRHEGSVFKNPVALTHRIAASVEAQRGKDLAENGEIEWAVVAYRQALKFDPTIDLTTTIDYYPYHGDLESNNSLAVARRIAARKKLVEGHIQAEIDTNPQTTIAAYQAAFAFDSTIELSEDSNNPVVVAQRIIGYRLARNGDIEDAIAAYQAALDLEPDVDLNPRTEDLDSDPLALVRGLAAHGKVSEGRSLARNGDIEGAIALYQEALDLDPDIDLDSSTEILDSDPVVVAQKFSAPNKIKEGRRLVQAGDVEGAIAAYKQAQDFDPEVKISAEDWNKLCWDASLHGYPQEVLFACELAVQLGIGDSQASYLNFRDSRGLARALIGNIEGAIKDFQAFITSEDQSEEYKERRRRWIYALERGENPFTPKEIQTLLDDRYLE